MNRIRFFLFLFIFIVPACQDEKTPEPPAKDLVTLEREALLALYKALDGDHWRVNTNWCSDKPVSEWFGVKELNEEGRIVNMDLSLNNLTGVLPPEIGQLTALKSLSLNYNNLQGEIPEALGKLTDIEFLFLSNNQLTGSIPEFVGTLYKLRNLYLQNNQLTGALPESIVNLKELSILYLNNNRLTGGIPDKWEEFPKLSMLTLAWNELQGAVPEWMAEKSLEGNTFFRIAPQNKGHQIYVEMKSEGSPLHSDGEWECYMQATKGEGFSIVVIGDGFIREDNAVGGWAEKLMKKEIDYMFSLEPFRSLRDYFNVYLVYAYSNERGIGSEEYRMDTKFKLYQNGGAGLEMDLPDSWQDVAYNYLKEIGLHLELPSCVTFLSNSFVSAGRAVISDKFSVTCTSPLYATFVHETGGHGIGLLTDEYVINYTTIPVKESTEIQNNHKWGFDLNVDVTDDPQKIIWRDLLADPRYTGLVGIYEGGYYYEKGVWRSTESDIMFANTSIADRFSAVNRWLIYKRVMSKTVPGWIYDHEEFVKFDAPGRAKSQNEMNKMIQRFR